MQVWFRGETAIEDKPDDAGFFGDWFDTLVLNSSAAKVGLLRATS
jgi:hypothetical protein